jgi:hypothetical protein
MAVPGGISAGRIGSGFGAAFSGFEVGTNFPDAFSVTHLEGADAFYRPSKGRCRLAGFWQMMVPFWHDADAKTGHFPGRRKT